VDIIVADYDTIYRQSIDEPELFWENAAGEMIWEKSWDVVLDSSQPPFFRWFKGGTLNTCWNSLDIHVERGQGERHALILTVP
jgi:propionyl-CoA synthetase